MRTETNKLVTDLVNLDRVRSLLKTISYRRRFLAHLERKKAEKYDTGKLFHSVCKISITNFECRNPLHYCSRHSRNPSLVLPRYRLCWPGISFIPDTDRLQPLQWKRVLVDRRRLRRLKTTKK